MLSRAISEDTGLAIGSPTVEAFVMAEERNGRHSWQYELIRRGVSDEARPRRFSIKLAVLNMPGFSISVEVSSRESGRGMVQKRIADGSKRRTCQILLCLLSEA